MLGVGVMRAPVGTVSDPVMMRIVRGVFMRVFSH